MTGDVTVASGEALVVQPGVTIKAAAAGVSFVAMGHLRVLGTSTQPVWFTALMDDAHGGDSFSVSSSTPPLIEAITATNNAGDAVIRGAAGYTFCTSPRRAGYGATACSSWRNGSDGSRRDSPPGLLP
jgi:hypothetical protein